MPFFITLMACKPTNQILRGGVINGSTVFNNYNQHVKTDSLDGHPYIIIQRDNVVLDFNNSTIDGRSKSLLPDQYEGIAIHIKNCNNVTIKNLNVHGFKIAILAENVNGLKILSSNLSYNYRPKLYSHWDREALSDWLYFHQNEKDEWKNFGAAIYLKQCKNALIKDVLCHQGMNGLMMVQSEDCLVYNNNFSFNSGLGIGMYRSSNNRIMHNKLDWNARGYSHGKYARGQDSSAILLYEQSSHNTFAYNSATHSGDGLFLWAGQSTMDTGLGGCDSNMIYKNDFSHSIANGIEVTFSANYMIGNILNDCRYGVWGGYSHHSVIRSNEIKGCETGIAIENGRYNVIEDNVITQGKKGIQLWDRLIQPQDWPYAQKLNVSSRQYYIAYNQFENLNDALDVSSTDSIWTSNNSFINIQQEGTYISQTRDTRQPWMYMKASLPPEIKDGLLTALPPATLRGRKYIIINEWGPYDFQYPMLVLREKEKIGENEFLHFDIHGPSGTWRIDSIAGCEFPEHSSGTIPDSLELNCTLGKTQRYIGLMFEGEKIVTQLGDTIQANTPYHFHFSETLFISSWEVSFYTFDSLSDPLEFPLAFKKILDEAPLKTINTDQLAYRWWNKPDALVSADRFAVKASTSFYLPEGDYLLQSESDDGIRVWLDDKLILERWDIHTPLIHEVKFSATEGNHTLNVEYFEAGGLAVLDIAISPQ